MFLLFNGKKKKIWKVNNFQKYLLHVDSSRCTCMKHKFVCHFEILSRTSYFCWILSHTCLFWVLTSHISDKNINYNYSIQNIILLLHNFSLKKIFSRKKKNVSLGKMSKSSHQGWRVSQSLNSWPTDQEAGFEDENNHI